jgi:hypothetical protein
MSLPHDAAAERALVARLLLDPAQIPVLADRLSAEDFYSQDARAAYRAMSSLSSQGRSVDLVTIREEVGDNSLLNVSILDLTHGHTAPVEEYASIVRNLSVRRQVIEAARDVISAANEGSPDRMTDAAEIAFELASSTAHDDTLGLVDLAAYRMAPPPPLLGVLSPEGTTVLYGDGGDGKGWVAAKWASQLDAKVAIIDFENHPNEWAYRLDKFGMTDTLYVSPPVTLERWANERAARLLRNAKIGFLVIDSAMYASNVEDPYSPQSAMAYKRARSRLDNLPTILLAHTTGGQDKVFGCYSTDTEVLTRRGWLRHADMNNDDEVVEYDNGVLRWTRPLERLEYDYEGDMVAIRHASLDMLVTPNHRMVVRSVHANSFVPSSSRQLLVPRGWHFQPAENLRRSEWQVPYATPFEHQGGRRRSQDRARFLGWFLSEGHLGTGDRPYLTQVEGPLAVKMRETVQRLGWLFSYRINHYREHEQPCMQLYLKGGARRVGRWLRRAAGSHSWNKRIPWSVWAWDVDSKAALLGALLEGDGCERTESRWEYVTTSTDLADDVQRLSIELGYSARIARRSSGVVGLRDQYVVLIGSRPELNIRPSRVEKQSYSGKVYCLRVPSGAYLTRRNGYMGIAGNSVFWRNEARVVWRLSKNPLTRQRSLECRKANNYQDLEGTKFHIEFSEEQGILSLHPHGQSWSAEAAA